MIFPSSTRLHSLIFALAAYFLTFPRNSSQGSNEKQLLYDLLSEYNNLERPVANESEAVQLQVGLSLQQIIDVDEKNQILITNMWLTLEWNDYSLAWDPTEYGNVSDLRIPPHRIWRPDLLLYNSADEQFDATFPTNVVVRHTGACTYTAPGIFKSFCKIDVTWFPFDQQKCEFKFGSWTYDGGKLNLSMLDPASGGDLSSYIPNAEWEVMAMPGQRNAIYYACCPDPYVDISFHLNLRRRTAYYVNNLIVPAVLISSIAIVGFTLPPDSREKISLGVTILMSLTVFLNMVAETMPASSDAVPIISAFFNSIMFMMAISVICSILVVSLHFRKAETHGRPPKWVRVLFLRWLPRVLFMGLPHDTREPKQRSPDRDRPYKGGAKGSEDGEGEGWMTDVGTAAGGDPVTSQLGHILGELQSLTASILKQDDGRATRAEWKYIAMVVDRICLIAFSLFIIGVSVAFYRTVAPTTLM